MEHFFSTYMYIWSPYEKVNNVVVFSLLHFAHNLSSLTFLGIYLNMDINNGKLILGGRLMFTQNFGNSNSNIGIF